MAKTTTKVAAKKAATTKARKAAAKKTTTKVAVQKAQAPAPVIAEGAISVRIDTAGNVYEGKVDDVGAFIQSLGLTHTNTKTIIRAEFDGRFAEQVIFTAKARRLFTNKMAALVFDRNLKRALAYDNPGAQ